RIEAGDEEVRSASNGNAGDGGAFWDVEHEHGAVGEGDKAKLRVAGDGNRLRGCAEVEKARRFRGYGRTALSNRGQNVGRVVLWVTLLPGRRWAGGFRRCGELSSRWDRGHRRGYLLVQRRRGRLHRG